MRLGADKVRTVMMPVALHGRYQLDRRARHGGAAGVQYDEIAIAPTFDALRPR